MRPKPSKLSLDKRPCGRPEGDGQAGSSSGRQWAEDVFGAALLGDERLTKRLVQIGTACAERPLDSLPQACGTWAPTKGAYRFIENEKVTKEAILESVYEATARRCAGRESILAVQDTTTLTFPRAHEAAGGFGYINDTNLPGMLVHSTLALRENGVALGLLDMQMWTRDIAERGKKHQRKQRPIEQKESAKWLRGMQAARQTLSQAVPEAQRPRCIHVMDREGDIHEVLEAIVRSGDGVVVRATQDRRVRCENNDFALAYAQVRAQAPLGERIVDVPRKGSRKAREAKTVVRACELALAPSAAYPKRQTLSLALVEVFEENPPAGVEPLHWLLWTTEPAQTLNQALRIVGIYEKRWKIEDYHLTLKSGCRVEQLRMHTAQRIAKTIAIYAPVAVRIVELRDLARIEPQAPCTAVLSPIEWRALWTAIHKTPPLANTKPPTLKQAVLWIGRLGGHLGRKGDGMPGVTTLWRGLRDLQMLAAMYQSLRPDLPSSPNP